jgi:hypothetical protein
VTLVEFLRARLDEDERDARWLLTEQGRDLVGELACMLEDEDTRHGLVNYWFETMGSGWVRTNWRRIAEIATADDGMRLDPARVLADVAAKRRLLDAMIGPALSCAVAGTCDAGLATARFLALPYATHPDYRSEWAP